MMSLNEDILDAIRNRRYNLKQTPPKEEIEDGVVADATNSSRSSCSRSSSSSNIKSLHESKAYTSDQNIIARILHRRLTMEYDQSEDDDGEDGEDATSHGSDFDSLKSFDTTASAGTTATRMDLDDLQKTAEEAAEKNIY